MLKKGPLFGTIKYKDRLLYLLKLFNFNEILTAAWSCQFSKIKNHSHFFFLK